MSCRSVRVEVGIRSTCYLLVCCPDMVLPGHEWVADVASNSTAMRAEWPIAQGARRIVLVLDQAGDHTGPLAQVPEGLHSAFPPPSSPELQPAEHLRPLSDEPRVNRPFATLDALEGALAAHCDRLQHQPEVLRSAAAFHRWPAAV